MKNLLFTFTLLFTIFGSLNFSLAQSIGNLGGNVDRQQIERELERQIANDTNESVRVRISSSDTYYISNRETGVRGQARLESRRNNRSDIWYDVIIDTRRDRITRVNWSDRNQNDGWDRGRNDNRNNNNSGALRSGRYEIQVISNRRLLVAGNNGQVIQTNSGNTRSRQWDIEEAGNGYYYVRSVETGEVMTVSGNGDSNSRIVLARQGGNRDAQMWDIRLESDNRYAFLAPTGRSLDAPGNMRYDGAEMQIFKRNGGDNQRFWLRWISDIRRGDYDRGGNRGDRWRDRWDGRDRPAHPGSLSWRGRVDDVIEIEIRDDQIYERTISGQSVADVSSHFNTNMPRRRVNVFVEKVRGRGNVDIVEQPSSRNNFTTIVRIRDTRGGADDYEIEVYWE